MSNSLQCGKCAALLPGSARFCPKCGALKEESPKRTSEGKVCPICGVENPPTARFCKKDGTPLSAPAAPIISAGTQTPAAPSPASMQTPVPPSAQAEPANLPTGAMVCSHCGSSYPSAVKFCKKDGTPLSRSALGPEAAIRPTGTEKASLPLPPIIAAASTAPSQAPAQADPAPHSVNVLGSRSGISDSPTIQFRKTDGMPLSPVLAKGAPEDFPRKTSKAGGLSVRRIWPMIAAAGVLVCVIVAAYLTVRSTPASVQQLINSELASKGLASIVAHVDKEWVATLSGAAARPQDKDIALDLVRQQRKIHNVVDTVKLAPQPGALEEQLTEALAAAGLAGIKAEVDAGLGVTLTGEVERAELRNEAEKIAKRFPDLISVSNQVHIRAPQPPKREYPTNDLDPARVEGEINRALRSAGLGSVTSVVSDDFQVTLKGSVGSRENKERAFALARGFAAVRKVKDLVFIVQN